MNAITTERVNEVRVWLAFGTALPKLRELERFCETLRDAGAQGDLPIGLIKNGSAITLASVVKLHDAAPANPAADGEIHYRDGSVIPS